MYVVKKSIHNPILVPDRNHYWETAASFNLCPIKKGKNIFGFYRAISAKDILEKPENLSIIGIAQSKDGINFKKREKFIYPQEEWEKYGCEDPRVVYFEGKYYIFYTALSSFPFSAEGIKIAVAISKDLKKIQERHLITPFNAKAMILFPKRINGKITAIFSFHTDQPPTQMVLIQVNEIEELWSENFWRDWEKEKNKTILNLKRLESDQIEVGAPPIYTSKGWLLIYSHIQNYYQREENLDKIFGIEAVLLDLKDPTKILGKTAGPILVPNENYELSGCVPNVIFPSGALLKKDVLTIYYGSADTTVSCASVYLPDLLNTILPQKSDEYLFKRFKGNPIIVPQEKNSWEAKATFNPAAIRIKNKIHLLYRALSNDNTSSFGYACTQDGMNLIEKDSQPVYFPREDFEMKKVPGGNSGCEDPRLIKINKKIYLFYTAYDGINSPRVAVSSIFEKDFLNKRWNWEKPIIISPYNLDDKDTCLFPEKLPKGYFIVHRLGNEICGDYLKSLDFQKEKIDKCVRIIGPRINSWDSAKVGITAPPIKTKYGWLLFYHGISRSHNTYRIGVLLLDLKDPAIVLARSSDIVFEPLEKYEKEGIVNNVVFPCGIVLVKKELFMYYGGGDKVVGVATIQLNKVLKVLANSLKLKE